MHTSESGRKLRVLPIQHSNHSSSFGGSWLACRLQLENLLPCIVWLRSYKWGDYLKKDALAGITIATMLVPQAMSYAKLAGLPPIQGLYSGFIPNLAYGIFGSSRQVANGPVALVSLLVYNVLSAYPATECIQLATLLALMVGLAECVMGLLRLGWLIRFISHSVTSGFTSASAIIIGLSQAKYFLGYSISRSNQIIPIAKSIIDGFENFKLNPFLMGCFMLAILLSMKHLGKNSKRLRYLRAAGPLTAVVVGTILVKLFRPQYITVVGPIPQGLPSFAPVTSFEHASGLISTAFVITGVAILESVAIAKTLAAKHGYEIDANQELFGLGMANVLGSFFQSYPTTGSFSRSAVNHESGAETGLAGMITGFSIGCVLVFLTPVFTEVPECALAAIVVSAVIGLIDYEEAIFLWKIKKKDLCLWVVAFIFTLLLGVEIGVLTAVGLSLVFVIYESANPRIAVLGRLPGTTVYRNVKQYPDAYTYHGIVIVRIDAPMYFANISFIKDALRKFELSSKIYPNRGSESNDIRFVIIEMSPITYVDSTAIHALKELYHEYKARDIQMALSNPNEQVMKTLARAGIPEVCLRTMRADMSSSRSEAVIDGDEHSPLLPV